MESDRLYWTHQPLSPTQRIQNAGTQPVGSTKKKKTCGTSFDSILRDAENKVSFSQHALKRIQDRNLGFSEQDLSALDTTVAQMARKGARESLIFMNDMALIVSVANKTVITAMDRESAKESIFTNIDSAAIL